MQVPARLMRQAAAPASHELIITGAYADAPPVTFVDHYAAHIGSSYFMSPFDEAAIAVIDGRGEKSTGLLGSARGVRIARDVEIQYPHSIGLFYGAVTQHLGFVPDSDEWKVMALGAYADPENAYLPELRRLIRLNSDGSFELALEYFAFYNQTDRRMYSDKFVGAFGPPRRVGEPITSRHEELAAASQYVFEQAMSAVLCAVHERTGLPRIAVSGGCFMNSVFNGRIHELTPFAESYVPSCPDDSGTSVGAAMYLAAVRSGERGPVPPPHNFWGPSYTDQQCLEAVQLYRLPNAQVLASPTEQAARDLDEGKIVGWFQGPMEFGQRALGHRSILLDPRRPDGKALINGAVKYREEFRPFAPAVLAERVNEWFDCPPEARVPFMERVYAFQTEKRDQVPAVVHRDGTGRLQTVDTTSNCPRFRLLLEQFHARTGVPMLLNTSFNLNGEPIVCSPSDAIRTFYTCAIDVLYLGNVRVAK